MLIDRGAGKPLHQALPAYVSPISFGALSLEAKLALARFPDFGASGDLATRIEEIRQLADGQNPVGIAT